MKKEIIGPIVFLFLIGLAYAFGVVSNDYSINSYHIGLAGQGPSNSQYESRFTLTYQQGTDEDARDATYTANIGWFPFPSFCGDGTCDAGESCSSCPGDCGVCPEGPGGEGGEGCTYNWVCSDWYPEPCPEDGIQHRVCVNKGTCSGTLGMPNQTRRCIPAVPVPTEPLFDLFAKIPLRYKWVNPGDVIGIDIRLVNLGDTTPIDVFFKYWIVDENSKLISELQETRAVGEGDSFRIAMVLPAEAELGIYKFYAQINYDLDKTAIAEDSFEIVQSRIGKLIWAIFLWLIIVLVIIILLLIIIKLLSKRKEKLGQQ